MGGVEVADAVPGHGHRGRGDDEQEERRQGIEPELEGGERRNVPAGSVEGCRAVSAEIASATPQRAPEAMRSEGRTRLTACQATGKDNGAHGGQQVARDRRQHDGAREVRGGHDGLVRLHAGPSGRLVRRRFSHRLQGDELAFEDGAGDVEQRIDLRVGAIVDARPFLAAATNWRVRSTASCWLTEEASMARAACSSDTVRSPSRSNSRMRMRTGCPSALKSSALKPCSTMLSHP